MVIVWALVLMLHTTGEAFDAASTKALIEHTRRLGHDAFYVPDVAISLGLSRGDGLVVKQIEVRFSDNHRRFIAVTERDELVLTHRRQAGSYTLVTNVARVVITAVKRSVSGTLIPMDPVEAGEALVTELSFWTQHLLGSDGRATGLEAFDRTLHKTNRWLSDLMEGWAVARATTLTARSAPLHALRDRLTVEDTAQLAVQLPMLVRGFYYEGCNPPTSPCASAGSRNSCRGLRPERSAHASGSSTRQPVALERCAAAMTS